MNICKGKTCYVRLLMVTRTCVLVLAQHRIMFMGEIGIKPKRSPEKLGTPIVRYLFDIKPRNLSDF